MPCLTCQNSPTKSPAAIQPPTTPQGYCSLCPVTEGTGDGPVQRVASTNPVSCGENQAEAVVVVPVTRLVPVAVGRPSVAGGVVPAAAAHNAFGTPWNHPLCAISRRRKPAASATLVKATMAVTRRASSSSASIPAAAAPSYTASLRAKRLRLRGASNKCQ